MECRLGKKWTAHTLSGAMLAVLAALALIGAGCGNNHPTGPKGGEGSGGSAFINGDDEAWTTCYPERTDVHSPEGEECYGFTFKSDSTLFYVYGEGKHSWKADLLITGTWESSVKDSSLTVYINGNHFFTGTYVMNDKKTSVTILTTDNGHITLIKTHEVKGIPRVQTPAKGGNPVNGANEAWVFCEDEYEYGEYCNGYIFRSDSSYQIIQKSGDHWFQTHSSTYVIDSTDIIFDGETASFTVSGDSLTLNFGYRVEQRTRTQVSILTNHGTGGNLVLGEDQAWTYNDVHYDEGYIFRSDGTFINIDREKGGDWRKEFEGTYTTSGGNITLTHAWGSESGTYTVTGTTLILTVAESAYTYTEILAVTNNVVIVDDDDSTTCSRPTIELTENAWAYDSLNLSSCDFLYSFNVAAGQTYFVSLDDRHSGPKTRTGDVIIMCAYSDGMVIFDDVDDPVGPEVFTANRTGTVYIRVHMASAGSGTFGVMWARTNHGDIDVRLVNNTNEAWVDTYEAGGRDGFILHANGTYTAVTDYPPANGLWTHDGSGTWHTTGNVLTLSGDGYYARNIGSGNYTVSGNTLEWGGFGGETFTKASGVIISSYASMSPPDYAENPLRKQKLASLSKKPSPQKQTSLSKQPSIPKKPSARKKPAWPGKFSSSK